MATKKTAAPSKPAVKTDVKDPSAKVSTQLTAKKITRTSKPAAEPAKAPAKKAAAKPAAKPAAKKTATKSVVSPATTKAIKDGAAAVKSVEKAATSKKPARQRIFKSLDSGATATSSIKIDPPAAAATIEIKPEVKKPARRTYKAKVTTALQKKAEELIAEAAAAGLIVCIAMEGGKPGIKFYEAATVSTKGGASVSGAAA